MLVDWLMNGRVGRVGSLGRFGKLGRLGKLGKVGRVGNLNPSKVVGAAVVGKTSFKLSRDDLRT